MQIQISWLLKKPTDLDLHCLQKQRISGFSKTSVKEGSHKASIPHKKQKQTNKNQKTTTTTKKTKQKQTKNKSKKTKNKKTTTKKQKTKKKTTTDNKVDSLTAVAHHGRPTGKRFRIRISTLKRTAFITTMGRCRGERTFLARKKKKNHISSWNFLWTKLIFRNVCRTLTSNRFS